MKQLLIYGIRCGWINFENDVFLPYLKNKIDAIKIFGEIEQLQTYLKGEGSIHVNYVLPLTDINCREINNANIKAMIPNADVLRTFSDKRVFSEYVKKNNLTKYFPQVFTGPNVHKQLVVVKPIIGGGSCGVYFTQLNKLKKEDFIENTVQEYIYSTIEFAGYFIADEGRIIHSFAYYREYPSCPYIKSVNDVSIQKKTHIDEVYVKIIEEFVKPVSYTGAFCVDFKLAKDTLIVLEINPRLGASVSYPQNIEDGAAYVSHIIDVYKNKI